MSITVVMSSSGVPSCSRWTWLLSGSCSRSTATHFAIRVRGRQWRYTRVGGPSARRAARSVASRMCAWSRWPSLAHRASRRPSVVARRSSAAIASATDSSGSAHSVPGRVRRPCPNRASRRAPRGRHPGTRRRRVVPSRTTAMSASSSPRPGVGEPGLAAGGARNHRADARSMRVGEQRAASERLVVGMGNDHQHRLLVSCVVLRRFHAIGSIRSTYCQWQYVKLSDAARAHIDVPCAAGPARRPAVEHLRTGEAGGTQPRLVLAPSRTQGLRRSEAARRRRLRQNDR